MCGLDNLNQLREDLWTRWGRAFDRIGELDQASHPALRVVYSVAPLFDLTEYRPPDFLPGKRMLEEAPQDTTFYCTYSLNAMGRPIHMARRHAFNKIDWQGCYIYADDEVEYLEFFLQSAVVNKYTRITLRDGVPATLQHMWINCGGHFGDRKGKEALDFIVRNPDQYLVHVEDYAVADGRVISGRALVDGFSRGERRSVLEYSYSNTGRLERIVRTFDDGRKSTDYAAPTNSSLPELADRLSQKIADRVIDGLKQVSYDSPLLTVELFYKSDYVPYVTALTEEGFRAEPGLCGVNSYKHRQEVDLKPEDFEPDMAEFTERLDADEQSGAGTDMLRQAALMITKRAPDSIQTSPAFVAFAIDWESEGHDLHSILKQCGAGNATLKELKTIGWLD
jgi:hypothetical protein